MQDYQPLDPKDLERSYFLLTHKDSIKKIFLLILGVFILAIYLIFVLNFIPFVKAGSLNNLAQSIGQSYNWSTFHASRQPQPLRNSSPQFFSLGGGNYNLLSIVENPNQDWAISSLDYKFVINGQELPVQKAFLNRGQSRLFTKMSHREDKGISSLEIKIENIKWYRAENDIPEIAWEINEVNFQPASRQTVEGRTFDIPARVTWQARNLSLYNFWEVDWQIVLMAGDRAVGFNELKSRDFMSLEKKELEIVWLYDLPRVSTVEIYPILNSLDFSNFKNLQLDPSSGDRFRL